MLHLANAPTITVLAFIWGPAGATAPPADLAAVFQQGLLHARQAPPPKAATALRAAPRSPAAPAASNHLGLISARIRKLPQTRLLYGHHMARQQPAVSLYNRGVRLLRRQHYALAAQDFLDAVRQTSICPEAWCNLGVALYQLHRYRSAEHALRRALRQRIDYAKAWNNLGAVYAEMGQVGYAAVAFQVALTYDTTCAVARRNLARITGPILP